MRQDDKVLSQFLLEEESCSEQSGQNLFDWIRDFKDYEIRKEMQTRIDELRADVDLKDKEISALKVQIEEIVHDLTTQTHHLHKPSSQS